MTDFIPGMLNQETLPLLDDPVYATSSATRALQGLLKEALKAQQTVPLHELGWYINHDLIQNLYQWIVELHSFDLQLPLAQDMKTAGIRSIVMELRFDKDFPHSPPFIRVIRPRFRLVSQGGGGHVTAGGAMCMELLTNTGWSVVNTFESVMLQVRLALMNPEPYPARLENPHPSACVAGYGTGEAIQAYIRACNAHGWKIPEGFRDFGSTAARMRQ